MSEKCCAMVMCFVPSSFAVVLRCEVHGVHCVCCVIRLANSIIKSPSPSRCFPSPNHLVQRPTIRVPTLINWVRRPTRLSSLTPLYRSPSPILLNRLSRLSLLRLLPARVSVPYKHTTLTSLDNITNVPIQITRQIRLAPSPTHPLPTLGNSIRHAPLPRRSHLLAIELLMPAYILMR